jgi:hypothetical protein
MRARSHIPAGTQITEGLGTTQAPHAPKLVRPGTSRSSCREARIHSVAATGRLVHHQSTIELTLESYDFDYGVVVDLPAPCLHSALGGANRRQLRTLIARSLVRTRVAPHRDLQTEAPGSCEAIMSAPSAQANRPSSRLILGDLAPDSGKLHSIEVGTSEVRCRALRGLPGLHGHQGCSRQGTKCVPHHWRFHERRERTELPCTASLRTPIRAHALRASFGRHPSRVFQLTGCPGTEDLSRTRADRNSAWLQLQITPPSIVQC